MSMHNLLADARHSLRLLRRAPGFALAVILILGLGIGANSALFTALDHALIRPLPYANPDRLMVLWEDFSAFGVPQQRVSPATFLDWKKRTHAFDEVAAYGGRVFNLSGGGTPEEVLGSGVTANLLPMLGVRPLLGRTFTPDEDAPGNKTVVLTHRLWTRRFGGDPGLVGKSILMSGEKYTVIGVMPKGFQYPDQQSEVWVPLGLTPLLLARRNSHFLYVTARLRPDQSVRQGQADMNVIARDLAREFPASNDRVGITVVPLKAELLGNRGKEFILLLGAAACVLLIACANVANLLLARSAARQRETAIRAALGASPGRVLRQILTENLVIGAAGGALGLLFGQWSMAGLKGMVPEGLAGIVDMKLDGRAVAFTAALSVLTGVLFGLMPALQLSKPGGFSALKHVGRSSIASGGRRLGDILVAGEIAIALVLVIGAVLLIQTLVGLRAVDPGFRADRILAAEIVAPSPKYQESGKRRQFYSQILEKVRAIPGVKSAGLSSDLPYQSHGNTMHLTVEGQETQAGLGMDTLFRLVSAGYLETIGARLKEGRFLSERDQQDAPAVVVVNESLARQYWPNQSPIGHRIDTGTGDGTPKWMTIVGVVQNIRERGLDLPDKSAVYVPFTQTTIGFFLPDEIAVLTSREPLSLSKELQQAVWSVDREQPVNRIMPLEAVVEDELANRQQILRLLGAFAGLALVLAALGVHSVLAYLVSQRTPEIGLRMVLGATRWNIMRTLLSHAARVTGVGLAIGALGALGATRGLSSLLFGVGSADPATFVGVALGLGAVALAASLVPVVRAAAVDPLIALRQE
jgi:putative ABC transport system permease protein